MDNKKLFLLDAYALIYRAYYALIHAPVNPAAGFNTAAVYGFCNTLDEVLRKENPDYIAVCFDPPHGKTFRHEAYEQYKAQRDKQPEDITLAIPYIKDILKAYRIAVIERENFEADDVIGTLAKQAEQQGYTTYMMTLDKDYGQLVDTHTFMYRPATRGQGFEIRGPREVCERYGISRPDQVIDLLALEGDASDNIPGCPGVGEKTASKLIAQWDTVENLLEHVGEVKGAVGRKLAENAEQVIFSKFLATIKTDVPLDGLSIADLERRQPDLKSLTEIFTRLNFRTLLARVNAKAKVQTAEIPPVVSNTDGQLSLFDQPAEAAVATEAVAIQAPAEYNRIDGPDAVKATVTRALAADSVAVMVNSSSESDAMDARWLGVAVCTSGSTPDYIAIPNELDPDRQAVIDALRPLWGGPAVITDSAKHAMVLLRRHGIDFTADYFDTSLAHYLLSPESRHDLAALAHQYLQEDTVDFPLTATERARLYNSGDRMAVTARCQAAALALKLRPRLLQQIDETGLHSLLYDLELPFARVLADMEYTGVRIDSRQLADMSQRLSSQLAGLEEEAYRLAGHRFNLGSPSQVGEVLFGEMMIDPKAKRTKRGQFSTTEEILEKYRHSQPVVDVILNYRGLKKLLTTYIDALPGLVDRQTGKIHTTFNQTATATGRISSTNPNLQNIPVRTDLGREIRRAFVPDPGHLMLAADYSQIELRLMADISGDQAMIDAFLSGEDFHRETAAKIYHEPLDQVTDNQRRAAKTANFGIIYGISAFGLSERLGISRSEAKQLIEGYLSTYPGVKQYMEDAVEKARLDGAVTTVMGRRRLLPEINSRNAVVRAYAERNAVNAPLQGSAADIIKKAMIAINRRIAAEGLGSRMILQVHDELVFDVVPEELDRLRTLVVSEMENAYHGRVPLTVGVGVADNWLDAH